MDRVTVKKDALLEALRTNREAHQGIFDEAVEGYQQEAERRLKAHLKEVRSGKMKQVAVFLDVPVNHTKDYDRIIKMVEMSVDDEIVLTQQNFSAFVMDDWTWKQQFLTSNSTYSATATRMLEQ